MEKAAAFGGAIVLGITFMFGSTPMTFVVVAAWMLFAFVVIVRSALR